MRWLGKALGGLVEFLIGSGKLLLLVPALVWLLLLTPWGLERVETRLNRALDRGEAGAVKLRGAAGGGPFLGRGGRGVGVVGVGPGLWEQGVSVRLSLRALARGEIGFRRLAAREILIERRPGADKGEEREEVKRGEVWIPAFSVRHLDVESVEVGELVTGGERVWGRVAGRASHHLRHGWEAKVSVERGRYFDLEFEAEVEGMAGPDGRGGIWFTGRSANDHVQGWIELDAGWAPVDLRARVGVEEAARYERMYPHGLVGRVLAGARATGRSGERNLEARLRGERLGWNEVAVDQIEVMVKGSEPWGAGQVEISGEAKGVAVEGVKADGLRVEIVADERRGGLSAEVRLADPYPGSVEVTGGFLWDEDGIDVWGLEVRGNGEGVFLGTVKPMDGSWRDGVLNLPGFSWRLNEARLEGRLLMEPEERVDLAMVVENVDLRMLGWVGVTNVAGRARGSLAVEGPWRESRGQLEVEADGLVYCPLEGHRFAPTALVARVEWVGQRAEIYGRVNGRKLEPVALAGSLPLLEPVDPLPRVDRQGFMAIEVAAGQELPDWTPMDGQARYEGKGQVALYVRVLGTVEAPMLLGDITLKHAGFRDTFSGIQWEPIDVHLVSSGRTVRIEQATVVDGQGGTLEAFGFAAWPVGGEPAGEVDVVLANLVVVQAAFGSIPASGYLSIRGAGQRWGAEGEFLMERTHVSIPRTLPVSVADLEVIDLNAPPHLRTTRREREETHMGSDLEIPLSLQVRTVSDIHVTGRGLVSDWTVRLNIDGTANDPMVVGSARMTRGTLFLLGRRFDMTQAEVLFSGATPPDPHLAIRAQTQASGYLILLDVSGPVSSPSLTLRSVPELPENEVISYLLFGRSTDQITPLQAVTLAYNLNLLAGGGNAFGILEQGQSRLGIDQLEVVLDEEEAAFAAVTVGKYVGSRFYIEGRRGLGGGNDEVAVEVFLTPTLSLRTEATPGIREGIGITWRREY